MKLAVAALVLCATRVAAADSHATLVIDKCMLSVEIDRRVVYRGKPMCQNKPRELEIKVPKSRGVHVRTNNAAHYANGGLWVEHDDEFLMPLVAGNRYEIGEGFAYFDHGGPQPKGKHCVGVSRDRGAKFDAWRVSYYGTRDDFFDFTTPSYVGGEHARHELFVSSSVKEHDGKLVEYYRLHAGTYRFHVARGGRISLSFTDADLCATP